MISPLIFLVLLIAVTAACALIARSMRERAARRIEDMARNWNLRFAPEDRFHLSLQVASLIPIPGAADVVVRDIIYCQDSGSYRYLFTVEYTLGILRTKHRRSSAAVLTESRTCPAAQAYSPVTLGSRELPLHDQYTALHRQFFATPTASV